MEHPREYSPLLAAISISYNFPRIWKIDCNYEVYQSGVEMRSLITDLRYAVRQLAKSPGFTAVAVLTLALGIGANTLVFSLANAFLVRSLPYSHPERLGVLLNQFSGRPDSEQNSLMNVLHDGESWELVRDHVPSIEVAASSAPNVPGAPQTIVNVKIGDQVESVRGGRITAQYFDVMGVRPLVGREFTREEDRPNGPNAVVLSYELWNRMFHRDHDVVGKAMLVKGALHTIVGVMPPNLTTTTPAELWTPLRVAANVGEGGGMNFFIYMRLRDGATWQQADAELSRLRPRILSLIIKDYPKAHAWMFAEPLQGTVGAIAQTPILILVGAVTLILLIACANLAGIMLARVSARRHEIATRLALGATVTSVLRNFWMEALVVAAIGTACGIALAQGLLQWAMQSPQIRNLPTGPLSLDWRVVLFAVVCMLLTSVLVGALPALEGRRVDILSMLSSSGNRGVVTSQSRRLRQSLIAGEVALTVVLLTAAGLLVRTLISLHNLPPGFNPQNLVLTKASLDDVRYHDPAALSQLFTRTLDPIRRIPGVKSAAVGLAVPYERSINGGIHVIDGPTADKDDQADMIFVTPGYFETLEIPFIAGRGIRDSDNASSQPVAVVNENFARSFLGGMDVIGRHFKQGKTNIEVIGVVGNVVQTPGLADSAPITSEPTAYIPYLQQPPEFTSLAHIWFQPSWIVRTSGNNAEVAKALHAALESGDPGLPFSPPFTMNDLRATALEYQHIEVWLLSALAALGLALSSIGIYGLVANMVVQRRREIGVRMALGATVKDAVIEIGSSGLRASLLGLLVGVVLSFFAATLLRSFLYGVSTHDSITLVVVPLVLAVVALAASFMPTFRIAGIEPAETLRAE